MKQLILLLTLNVLIFQDALPPVDQVTPVNIVDLPGFTEGIVFDHADNAFVSLPGREAIYRISRDGKATLWATLTEPNGHKVLADGTHLVAARGAIYHLKADGTIEGKVVSKYEGKPLRNPNDLCLDKHGGFYFTDPGAIEDARQCLGRIYYVDASHKIYKVSEDLSYPNGIVLRPDGRALLVSESGANRILSYRIESPGTATSTGSFATLPSKEGRIGVDGMCLDEAGNLYVAYYGMREVHVIDSHGTSIRRYPAGNLTASNVAFGGPNMDQLYITGAPDTADGTGAVFRIDLIGVKGLKILPERAQSK